MREFDRRCVPGAEEVYGRMPEVGEAVSRFCVLSHSFV